MVLDCDPGIDDALALYAALASRDITLQGVTTVFGNVPVKQATRNIGRLLRLVPHAPSVAIGEGSDQPLTGSRLPRRFLHGRDGLGDLGIPVVAALSSGLKSTPLILDRLRTRALDEIVALGPLTNVAHAYAAAPRLLRQLRGMTVMAGVMVDRAEARATEFNLASDPAAARCLLGSQVPLRWVPMNVAGAVRFPHDAIDRFGAAHARSQLARTIAQLMAYAAKARGVAAAVLPDAVALMLALDPALGRWRQVRLALTGTARSGRLRIEAGVPNAQLCEGLDESRVAERLWTLWERLVTAQL